eukprot:TRINITY_DN7536_c0_g1_i1.p1 TRINITY_DN7536_c0_g1~~TRINITY_DN7536_c0_g1_i1.p1  ORF type:complete len:380 (-),score=77.50 TRINITY_DN7536_c0_g1_i1:205-1239(-)
MEDDDVEFTLLNLREISVFRIPPASSSSGHKAEDWKQCIWRGRCRLCGKGKDLFIKMVDATSNELFAQCTIPLGEHEKYVERVTDSSRYFVLKIQNGSRHAFIGVGFQERNDAFDFNCSLADFKKTWVDRDEVSDAPQEQQPARDLSLKEGQKIQIKLKGLTGRTSSSRSSDTQNNGSGPIGFGALAPPPGTGVQSRIQQAAPLPPASSSAVGTSSLKAADDVDFFGDFADFQSATPGKPSTLAAPSPASSVSSAWSQQVSQEASGGDLSSQFGSLNLGGSSVAPAQSQAIPQQMRAVPQQGSFDPFASFGGGASSTSALASATVSTEAAKQGGDPFDEFNIFK